MRAFSSLTGLVLFFLGTLGAFLLAGGRVPVLWMPVTLTALVLAPLGNTILAFGFRHVWETFLTSRFLFVAPGAGFAGAKPQAVLRFLLGSLYAVGGLLSLFWLLIGLANVGRGGPYFAAAIGSLVYALLAAEGLLRPLKQRLELVASPTTAENRL